MPPPPSQPETGLTCELLASTGPSYSSAGPQAAQEELAMLLLMAGPGLAGLLATEHHAKMAACRCTPSRVD